MIKLKSFNPPSIEVTSRCFYVSYYSSSELSYISAEETKKHGNSFRLSNSKLRPHAIRAINEIVIDDNARAWQAKGKVETLAKSKLQSMCTRLWLRSPTISFERIIIGFAYTRMGRTWDGTAGGSWWFTSNHAISRSLKNKREGTV